MSTVAQQHGPARVWRPRRAWLASDGLRYLARRLGLGVLVIVLVALTVFVATRVVSDPVHQLLPQDASRQQYDQVRHSLGLDKSLVAQFGDYVRQLGTLDFGESYWQKTAVTELIGQRLPNTLVLVAVAMAFAMLFGIALGVLASLRPGSWLDQLFATVSLLGLSLPQFWLGSMLIYLVAVRWHALPTSGTGGVNHLILPAITLGIPSLGRIAQITRSTMIDELARPYVVTARAKGLSEPYVVLRHALRNAWVPILTLASWETATCLAGYSVVVETVFAWPGIGYLAIQAIQRDDLILVQGVVIVIALIVVLVNLVTDVLYTRIDPRIELR